MRIQPIGIALILVGNMAQASSVRPVRGIDVIVQKNPGGTARRITTSADGSITVAGLEPGSYTLTFNPCPEKRDGSQSNPITAFVIANPGTNAIRVTITNATCAVSSGLPLRGVQSAGNLTVIGEASPDVFAAGVEVDVTIGGNNSLQCQVSAVGSQ